jgi:phosphate acetyltransferase
MDIEEILSERARAKKRRIILSEGNDERILQAADIALQKGLADLTILGNPDEMSQHCEALGLKHIRAAEFLDHRKSPFFDEFVQTFYNLRKSKGITAEQAAKQLEDRNYFAVMAVHCKKAHGLVSGVDGTTADSIRPTLSVIRTKPGCSIASSLFLMALPDGRLWFFSDCAINRNPVPAQLAEIAVVSAETVRALGIEPKVAMLSYSSGSSGTGPDVDAVREAVNIAKESADFPIDGPIQFDAAVDPKTGASKMPGSSVAGQANVMIFPDLNSGNICCKAVQRSANALAIGPIIQGLNAPVSELSRGALVRDIVNSIALTAVRVS